MIFVDNALNLCQRNYVNIANLHLATIYHFRLFFKILGAFVRLNTKYSLCKIAFIVVPIGKFRLPIGVICTNYLLRLLVFRLLYFPCRLLLIIIGSK